MASEELKSLLVRYQALVADYHALDRQIDGLLSVHGGHNDRLSPQDLERYRAWARRRDDLFSEIRALEQQLAMDDEG
ncbi:MAG: hypothetical protein NZ750_03705 [Anaerolineae bacterium]|nr:hypothetical protein [Anaerolineae bacterium]MDW8171427.1 hypothetical protein [Anaerolineae bacterium]